MSATSSSTPFAPNPPKDVQKLSIQLLDPERIDTFIRQAPSYTSQKERKLEELIFLIIEIYNAKATYKFELQATQKSYYHFYRSVYTQPKKGKTRLATEIESVAPGKKLAKKSDINFLFFFFRSAPSREIFAVTSGHSWQVVRPCINYQFTIKVALRILDPHRIMKITRRCLVGNNVQETLTNPSGHELLKTSNLYYLVESFVAPIKPGASILQPFEELKQKLPKHIKVSTGLLRINKEMPLENYPKLLDLLSKYNRDQKTYASHQNGPVEEVADPEFEFLRFLEEEHTLSPVLNKLLIKQIFSDHLNEQNYRAQFYHKYLQDFLKGNDFEIQSAPRKHYRPLSDYAPTLRDVASHLNSLDNELFSLSQSSSLEEAKEKVNNLYTLFNQASLKFQSDDKEICEKLVNYLEGEVRYQTASYFKARGMWYRLQADFHLLLQQDFRQLLRSLLMEPQNQLLHYPWSAGLASVIPGKRNKKEEAYNRLYLHTNCNKGQPFDATNGYLVFDQVLPFNIEPCDIVRYTPTTTYLIHVKAEFGQQTRDVCSQILNAAKQFRSLSLHQPHGFLLQLWHRAVGGTNTDFRSQVKQQLNHLGQENFLHIFSERKLVFVYAYVPPPSLYQESELPLFLTPTSLKGITGVKIDEKTLFDELIQSDYLDSRGRLTSKFYCCTQEMFKEEFQSQAKMTKEAKKAIYRHLSGFKSKSESTLAKLDLIQLAHEVRALGFELKICEIAPNEKGDKVIPPPSVLKTNFTFDLHDMIEDKTKAPPIRRRRVLHASPPLENAPRGFPNLGNSCYMNASLQLIFNCLELRNLTAQKHGTSVLIDHLIELMDENHLTLDRNLKELREIFFREGKPVGKITDQHDAHEFITFVLDQMEWKPVSTYNRFDTIQPEETTWNSALENTNHFSMSINDKVNLQEIIHDFFKPEFKTRRRQANYLGDKYSQWSQTPYIDFTKPPQHFIIQLKRFDSSGNKINTAIALPQNGLIDVKNHKGNGKGIRGKQYEIIGLVNHIGETISEGHYTALIKNFRDQNRPRWIECSDTDISESQYPIDSPDIYLILLKATNICHLSLKK